MSLKWNFYLNYTLLIIIKSKNKKLNNLKTFFCTISRKHNTYIIYFTKDKIKLNQPEKHKSIYYFKINYLKGHFTFFLKFHDEMLKNFSMRTLKFISNGFIKIFNMFAVLTWVYFCKFKDNLFQKNIIHFSPLRKKGERSIKKDLKRCK